MKIKCADCGYSETTDKDFFVTLIGGSMPVGGIWAWTSYLFAGTGFAMPIVIAIIGGGVAMLVFKDEIVQWIIDRGYKCRNQNCQSVSWIVITNSDKNESVKEFRKRISIAEAFLRSNEYEFDATSTGWTILELSGNLKEIDSIDELEQFVMEKSIANKAAQQSYG